MSYDIKVKTADGNIVACDVCQDFDAVKRWLLSMDLQPDSMVMQGGSVKIIGVKCVYNGDFGSYAFGVMNQDLEDGAVVRVQALGDNRVIEIKKEDE
jgi:hypothetical protein